MLDQELRTAILELHHKGHGSRAIARVLRISRWAVRMVLQSGSAEVPQIDRAEKADPFDAEIRELFVLCKGNLVRVHEELLSKGGSLSYPALTAFCRKHGVGHEPKKPAGRYHFEPGEETQHDTSPHFADIGGAETKVQTTSAVLCYSRLLFFQLYPAFNRFLCKVFITDAAQYFKGVTDRWMIDNTHVVVLRGTGKEMVPVPEMTAFAERLGFTFVAHEKGDANRSARVERPFHFIENNFLVNRKFRDFDHANREAIIWCDKVNATYRKHLKASARELFAVEQPRLKPLPIFLPEVYALHQRIVDIEGYIHLGANIYSVPYQLIGRQVEVRETKDLVRVFLGPRLVATHKKLLGGGGGRQRVTVPEHRPPRGQGPAVALQKSPDEQFLESAEPPLPEYAAALKKTSLRWPLLLRRLAQMSRDYPPVAFFAALKSAAQYRMFDIDRLERMVLRNVATDYFVLPIDREDTNEG